MIFAQCMSPYWIRQITFNPAESSDEPRVFEAVRDADGRTFTP